MVQKLVKWMRPSVTKIAKLDDGLAESPTVMVVETKNKRAG